MEPEDTSIRVPLRTGTHGDVLAAVGMADLLTSAFTDPVRLRAVDGAFLVLPPEPITSDVLARMLKAPGYAYMRPNEKAQFPVEVPAAERYDYPLESAEVKRKRDARAAVRKDEERLRKAGKDTTPLREEMARLVPPRDWCRWRAFNGLQGDETANRVYLAIQRDSTQSFAAVLRAGIGSLAGPGEAPGWGASPGQLFTPSWAKGYSRLKPDSTDRNKNVNEHWVNSFEEWLKYRGYFRVACPYFSGDDIRLVCPIPGDISVETLAAVCDRLLDVRLYGSDPKLDSLSVLTLAGILLDHSENNRTMDLFLDLWPGGWTPADLISGVHVTHYQSLGQSRAVSAMGALALPGWFPITSPADLRLWRAILAEHRTVLRSLHDDRSDEIGLLVLYRRFLECRQETALAALIDFMGAYGPLILRAREQRRPRFRTDYFRRIVNSMSPPLSEVLANPGFLAVASAIRRCTVSAQALKAMKKEYREIRYGLLSDLRRKSEVPGNRFLEAVADFVALYNAENAKRREGGLRPPRNITTEEFQAFASLVEEPCAVSTVGALLCAYATCREPREDEAPEPAASAIGSEIEGEN